MYLVWLAAKMDNCTYFNYMYRVVSKLDNGYLHSEFKPSLGFRFLSDIMMYPLHTKRNLRWINRIVHFHNNELDPMFVFGTNHLNGRFGVVNLLIRRGFGIEQYHIGENCYKQVTL